MPQTFIVKKIELIKILSLFNISDKNILEIISQLDKMHKHINAVTFIDLLQKYGLNYNQIRIILRRIGVSDVDISNMITLLEEEKIKMLYGNIIDIKVE